MRSIKALAVAIGAGLAAVAFTAPSVAADPHSWTITPAGAITAQAGVITYSDANGTNVTCASGGASGTTVPTPQSGDAVTLALFSEEHFDQPCDGPFGSEFTFESITTPNVSEWHFHGVDYLPTGGTHSTGAVSGYLDNIRIHVTSDWLTGPCEYDLVGEDGSAGQGLDAVYSNPSAAGHDGSLVVSPAASSPRSLSVINKVGGGYCGILGDTVTLNMTYTVRIGDVSPVIEGSML